MIPSASGGIGHISRTATLARALRRLDPLVEVVYVLDTDRLRPFNIDATMQMGFRPRLLPPRHRDSRDSIARACLGDVDVIVDDCTRYLLPLRQAVPMAAWVSIPMHPLGDELFLDWPLMKQMDAIIWAYMSLVDMPAEMEVVRDLIQVTGPFLDTDTVPSRTAARAKTGLTEGRSVVYAPRGFPFGREFGHRVLAGAFGAVAALRQTTCPDLRLVLLAVKDQAAELSGIAGLPNPLPDWVLVHGILPQAEALSQMRAADIVVAEGTSTMHEAASLGTPLVLVPGPIQETLLLARALGRHDAARVVEIERVGPDTRRRVPARSSTTRPLRPPCPPAPPNW